MKIALLGCGLIGEKRGKQLKGHTVVGVYDPDKRRAENLARALNTQVFADENALLKESGAEIVIVATTNNMLAPLTLKCIEEKKHVLVEKPAAVSVQEIQNLEAAAKKNHVVVKVGFNHRFHPALLKARELIDNGALGELMFLRARYGHGGRLGYEKEWRSDPKIGGGGELLDQGVHILDLVYWFMGPLPLQSSFVTTSFWKMDVDDNAVLTCTDNKKWATFHVSCTEWKNSFGLEIYGKSGKVLIDGLGRSYGVERLVYYKMLPDMNPPQIQTFEFDQDDHSWERDMQNLLDHLEKKTPLWGDLGSARYALEQVRDAYRANGYKNLPCSV